ncbi:hypothetical protein [Falsiroseomonas oryzae]|uniref:hypothetical protein n=1 Tax=Falsiroseomonas oryzae TaxID=2766473 RepID=UPI0022EA3E61|nr:hypothetical protein [Roseomonas sp. MO-31]
MATSTAWYLPNGKGAVWTAGDTVTTADNSKRDKGKTETHAERKAYDLVKNKAATVFCLVTDEFPCEYCATFFLLESKLKQRSFVLRCTANSGAYAKECGAVSTPQDNFVKTLTGDLYFSAGTLAIPRRVVTVTGIPDAFVDNVTKPAKFSSAAEQGPGAFLPQAPFRTLPALPG